MIHRSQNLAISADSAIVAGGLAINPTNVTAGKLAFAGMNNVTLTAGNTISDSDMLQIYQYISGTASLKRTMVIPGRKVTKFEVELYAPATRKVMAIGYNRKTLTGSIAVANNTEYEFSIVVTSDKQSFSQRSGRQTIDFTSAAAATQSTIATQIVNAINANEYLKKAMTAIKVGDGTGIYGLTGATNFGVEVTGKVLDQATGSFALEIPNFEIQLVDSLGFGNGAAATTISTPDQGVGSYQWVYNLENFLLGQEGKINRTAFPIATDYLQVSSTANLSAAVAGTGNVGTTIGSDVITFATTNASFVPGDLVEIDSANYEIKYLISTTSAVLNTVAAATAAAATMKKRVFYDVITIEFSNPNLIDGAGIMQDNLQSVVIAVPGATAGAAHGATSTAGASIQALLNPWMNSVGFASISL